MADVVRKPNRQSGVAALEFALTVPLFMMLLGAMFYFGIALYAKFVVTNAANVAVRACVYQQMGNSTDGAFTSCALQQYSYLVGGGGGYPNLCSGSSGAPSASFRTAAGALAQDIHLLVLTVPCNIAVGDIINGRNVYGGQKITQFSMQIVSSMPYTLYKTN